MSVLEHSLIISGVEPDALRRVPRRQLLLAAGSYLGFLGLSEVMGRLQLPYDEIFGRVLTLMWMGNLGVSRYVPSIAGILWWFSPVGLAIVLLAAAIPEAYQPKPFRVLAERACRNAVALPLFQVMTYHLSRYVANLIYVLAPYTRWDFTPVLGRIETPFLEGLQRVCYSPLLSVICSYMYSIIWLVALFAVALALIVLDEPAAMNRLITAFFLLSILAVPIFLLVPVFDPWTTNPLYSNPGAWHSGVRYLYPNANLFALRFVNAPLNKWATGASLPSLHVAFPLMVYWVLRKSRQRLMAGFYLLFAVATSFVVVYLGRHWVADAAFAVPYSYFVVRLAERLKLDFALV